MTKPGKRGVGRPRASQRPVVDSARQDILLAAAHLFGQQGFVGTTTHQIAAAVGIRQPSLFSHFKKKEDILRELVETIGAPWLAAIEVLNQRPGRGADRLYELMRTDFRFLLTEPYGVGALMNLPELRTGKFRLRADDFRGRITGLYRSLISQGIEEGDFSVEELDVATNTVFGMGEAIWSWYTPAKAPEPEAIAEQIADLAMRALLIRPGYLKAIKRRYATKTPISIDGPAC